ncbi:hypothetical protein PV326_011015, partial [Microctonus aethiopoides]
MEKKQRCYWSIPGVFRMLQLESLRIMAMIWKFGQINVAKQFYHGVKLLSRKNSAVPNVIQRLKSEISIKKRPETFYQPMIPPKKISKAEMKYQHLDKLSKDYTLIYRSSITGI